MRTQSQVKHNLQIESIGLIVRPSYIIIWHLQIEKLQTVQHNQRKFQNKDSIRNYWYIEILAAN